MYFYFYQFQLFNMYLTLSVQSGSAAVHVTSNGQIPSKVSYQWTTTSHLEIVGATAGMYLFAVYGSTASRFFLTVSTGSMVITLQEGIPYSDIIMTLNNYHYFQFTKTDPTTDLTITVTTTNGDPDLYVSTTRRRPNNTNYDWFSNNYGNDSLTILSTDPKACACVYNIAVLGFTANSSYTIVVTTGSSYIHLLNRVMQQGTVTANQYKYYDFVVSPILNSQLKFVSQATTGSAYLYISTTSQRPTSSNYQWKSESSSPQQVITITLTNTNFCANNMCRYFIGVYGNSGPAVFVLTATDDSE